MGPIRGNFAQVGYYDLCSGQGAAYQADLLNTMSYHQGVSVSTLSAGELSQLDVTVARKPIRMLAPTLSTIRTKANIDTAVQAGMSLVIFDWASNEALMPGPGSSVNFVRSGFNDLTVVGSTLVIDGPYATLNNSSLDQGSNSAHGYANSPLPANTTTHLLKPDGKPVMITYPYGEGSVTYANAPVSCYFPGKACNGLTPTANFIALAKNTLVYATDLAVRGPYATGDFDTEIVIYGPGLPALLLDRPG